MKKINRIRKNEEFQNIISKKQSAANQSFVIYYKKSLIENNTKVGISVSKKLGNAVIRNKIKRQVRMMVQEVFDLNSNFDYIIIVRQNYLLFTYSKNKSELIYILKKLQNKGGKTNV